jgi:ATP-binding cassette subfamily B multidrug efflux pump
MKNLRHLNKYLWKYRGRLFMGFAFIVLGNIFNVAAPEVIKEGIDFLISSLQNKPVDGQPYSETTIPEYVSWASSWLNTSGTSTIETWQSRVVAIGALLAGMYLLMYLIKGVFLFYQRQTVIVMSRYVEFDLKNEIFAKYQILDMKFYKNNRTGDLMNRISEDVNRVRMYLGPAIMYTMNLIVLFVLCIVMMLRTDVELTLYTMIPLPFMMISIFYVSTIINRRTEKVQRQQSLLSTMVQETISGIRVIKAFSREKYISEQFDKESSNYRIKQLKLVKTDALFMPVIWLLVGMSTILSVYMGGLKVISGEVSIGTIFQFVFYVNLLTWPFASVGWVSSLVQKAEASQSRINEFLNSTPDVKNTVSHKTSIKGNIEFKNVSFKYQEHGRPALADISFTAQSGTSVGITGRTGSGKSSLSNLIMRMYDPSSGEILIDGISLRETNLYDYRRNIGYVPQEVFLFSDTIENNILFGMDTDEKEKMYAAAKDADIHDSILGFPNQYQTLLGERGINLSGGQKQRVAIARAIAREPKILVFDDCLSAVDTETEERILQSLKRRTEGVTTFIISHRISSLKNCHTILFLQEGKIVESGTHDELIAKKGAYHQMFLQQSEEGSNFN